MDSITNAVEVTQCVDCAFPKCREACPSGAFSIDHAPWRATLSQDLCFACGQCVRLINQDDAFRCIGLQVSTGHLDRVIRWAKSRKHELAVIIGPGLERYADIVNLGQVATAWRVLGAKLVVRAGDFGNDARAGIVDESIDRIKKNGERFLIDSRCGSVRNMVSSLYPNLKDRLIKSDSTLLSAARNVRLQAPECKVVFLGPCVAYKQVVDELRSPPDESPTRVDAVLTWSDFQSLCFQEKLDVRKLARSEFDDIGGSCGTIPVAGDVKEALIPHNINTDVWIESAPREIVSYFGGLSRREVAPEPIGLVSAFFCGKCSNGPGVYASWRWTDFDQQTSNPTTFGCEQRCKDIPSPVTYVYNVENAGAVGPGARASKCAIGDNSRMESSDRKQTMRAESVELTQIWNECAREIQMDQLTDELRILLSSLRGLAVTPEELASVNEVEAAGREASNGNGPAALKHLKKAGAWIWDTATKIGIGIATALVKEKLRI